MVPISKSMTHTDLVLGVDTHKDQNTCTILDHAGMVVEQFQIPTTSCGNQSVLDRAQRHGTLVAAGVECTGSYGRSLAAFLTAHDVPVWEVRHPDRVLRRRRGKDDIQDSEAAARSLLSNAGITLSRRHQGDSEELRVLTNARNGLVDAHRNLVNLFKSMVLTSPDELRETLRVLPDPQLLKVCAAFRPSNGGVQNATKRALRVLAREILALKEQEKQLERALAEVLGSNHRALLAIPGVSTVSAASIIAEVGDDPTVFTRDSFTRHSGCAPVPASSGHSSRMRLNRGGNRTLNMRMHSISMTQMRCYGPAQDFRDKLKSQGKGSKDIRRSHKKYIARAVFQALVDDYQEGLKNLHV